MRFRFCGGLDAPDWLLGEIAVLSQLDADAARALANEVVKKITNAQKVDYSEVSSLSDSSDVKALMAAVHFIISNAAKYGVAEGTVNTEVQQLGLPRETSSLIAEVYKQNLSEITEALRRSTLALPKLGNLQWRVDSTLASSDHPNLNTATVQMAIGGDSENRIDFEMTAKEFAVLHGELQTAHRLMKEL